ncbi:MAG TPA: helix-turn-helix domain-containing protein [Solirubrobacteraceae bacterium]|nr:helix-turn-helix domain-containing protein [Solirubrobacteraceae bacterium]
MSGSWPSSTNGRRDGLVGAHAQLRVPLRSADVMTAAEVAELLGVPRSTVEDWARRSIVPSRKIGRRRLFLRPKIEALLLREDDEAVH